MGHSSRRSNVTLVLAALETCLRDLGYRAQAGRGRSAAADVYGGAEADRQSRQALIGSRTRAIGGAFLDRAFSRFAIGRLRLRSAMTSMTCLIADHWPSLQSAGIRSSTSSISTALTRTWASATSVLPRLWPHPPRRPCRASAAFSRPFRRRRRRHFLRASACSSSAFFFLTLQLGRSSSSARSSSSPSNLAATRNLAACCSSSCRDRPVRRRVVSLVRTRSTPASSWASSSRIELRCARIDRLEFASSSERSRRRCLHRRTPITRVASWQLSDRSRCRLRPGRVGSRCDSGRRRGRRSSRFEMSSTAGDPGRNWPPEVERRGVRPEAVPSRVDAAQS